MGVSQAVIDEMLKHPDKFVDFNAILAMEKDHKLKDKIGEKFKVEMVKNSTDITEFAIGKRIRRAKGDHKVNKFIEQLKLAINDPHFKSAANIPLKRLFQQINQLYDDKISNDAIQKYSLTEFC
mmetsp:Transcript_80073/g.173090  ORF Transcript_80073/g.173090 Transcript_80073/m.173090 type:complete len:124 (+) Transcript_80073:1114-1485(+)